jgi:hypothetical protein
MGGGHNRRRLEQFIPANIVSGLQYGGGQHHYRAALDRTAQRHVRYDRVATGRWGCEHREVPIRLRSGQALGPARDDGGGRKAWGA